MKKEMLSVRRQQTRSREAEGITGGRRQTSERCGCAWSFCVRVAVCDTLSYLKNKREHLSWRGFVAGTGLVGKWILRTKIGIGRVVIFFLWQVAGCCSTDLTMKEEDFTWRML